MSQMAPSSSSGFRPIRLAGGLLSFRLARGSLLRCSALAGVTALLAVMALSIGTVTLSFPEVLAALMGESSRQLHLLVVEWRLPRIAGALLAGAALGLAGALFQTLLRNPLGSPDVIGFDAGAFSGALLAITAGAAPAMVALSGFGGGLVAGLLVLIFSGRAQDTTSRIIVVGIAVGALFTAVNDWIILTVRLDTALAAANWRIGSLAGIRWDNLAQVAALLALLLPLGLLCHRPLRAFGLGEDRAAALGAHPGCVRMLVAAIGIALTATATFLTGPIGFVALIAPQIGLRLTGSSSPPLLGSALSGGLFLLASDMAGRLLFAPRAIPAGALTATVGGIYFVGLLWSRRTAAESRP
ncbi:MAG: iron-enterobactin transporter permease [Xanthobacteraceae bacterium]|nr:iron-enterobactin transporter permease [Xanthobacteraceae bacterium]